MIPKAFLSQDRKTSGEVLVLGAGIAGLTAAHELAERGLSVRILEMSPRLGGMAGCERDDHGRPAERSWRGFAPFYENVFEIMRRIPFGESDQSVYDQLSRPIRFLHPKHGPPGNREPWRRSYTWKDRRILTQQGLGL